MRYLYLLIFSGILNWKIKGDVPRNLRKYIIAVAPHTSNWDFMVGLAVRSILKFKSNYLAKKELFNSPLGWLYYRLGGHPVDRSQSASLVDQVADIFKSKDDFVIAVTPEGTRKNVTKWKTGFYYIALKGGIPIVMAGIDYPSRTVEFSKPFYPSGNYIEDAEEMMRFFRKFRGRNRNVSEAVSE